MVAAVNHLIDVFLIHIDEAGNEIWQKRFGSLLGETGLEIFQYPDGLIGISGGIWEDNNNDILLVKLDSFGNIFNSAIEGQVHFDPEGDCLPNAGESPFSNQLVQAISNDFSTATLTNIDGHFFYLLTLVTTKSSSPRPARTGRCAAARISLEVTEFYDTTALDFPVSATEDCPYLEVDISAPFLRRCFESTYHVHYCNLGTVPAEDARVEVTPTPFSATSAPPTFCFAKWKHALFRPRLRGGERMRRFSNHRTGRL